MFVEPSYKKVPHLQELFIKEFEISGSTDYGIKFAAVLKHNASGKECDCVEPS